MKAFSSRLRLSVVVGLFLIRATSPLAAAQEAGVTGHLVANGETVALPYVYLWAEKEGFYDSNDPTWTLLFVERALEPRELGDPIWDAAWVEIGITETSEFGDAPEVQVYSQSIKLSADSGGNISGGAYPEIELEGLGTERVSGRVYHESPQEFFDDTYQYDLTFSVGLSDPNAPIGDPLPAGGGEPGDAYRAWVAAVHSGDIARLQSMVPPEMAEQLGASSPEEAQEELGFMQSMTPTDVTVLGGSIDGDSAFLRVEGMMDGEKLEFEVTMTRMGEFWLVTGVSM